MTTRPRTAGARLTRPPARRRRLLAGLALLASLLVGLVATAPVAGAHHANISARSTCADGTYTISWTASSWTSVSSSSGRNPDVRVDYRIGSGGGWTALQNGAFTRDNGGSFSGSFTLPGSTTGTVNVRVSVHGTWGSGSAGGQTQIAPVVLDGSCTPPAEPSATAVVDCAADVVVLSFTGKNKPTTVTIRKNGVVVATGVNVPVGPSTYQVNLSAADENTTVTIALDYAVGVDQTLKVPVDCDTPPAPTAQITWACGADATVVLANAGGEPTVATIRKNGTVVDTVPLAGGASNVVRTVAMGAADENTTVTIVVSFDDPGTATDVTKAFEVDCTSPDPQVGAVVCATGGMSLALANTGTEAVTFVVTSPALPGGSTTVAVAAGGSASVLIPLAEDATTSLTVSVGGTVLYEEQALTRDCQKPAAQLVFSCAEGGIVVTLTNTGTEAATVSVAGEDVTVPAGGTTSVVEPVAEGEAYDLTVLGQRIQGVRDCEQPAATLVFDCAQGGVVVTLTNTGELPTTVTVAGTPHTVPAQGSTSVVVPVAEGADYDVAVTGDGLSTRLAGVRDCEQPGVASATLDCAAGGVVVTLTNAGALDTTVTVAGDPVLVPAGGAATVTVPVAENAAYAIDVLGDELDETFEGVRDCEQPDVEGITLECVSGGIRVVVANTGALDTVVTIAGTPVTVLAGDAVSHLVELDEDAEYSFTIEGDGLLQVVEGTLDCLQAVPVLDELACAADGLELILRNTGDDAATFTVTAPVLDDDVYLALAPGAVGRVALPLEEGESTDLRVVADGEVLFDETVERDCEDPEEPRQPQVLGTQIVRDGALPRTGQDVKALAAGASILLALGLAAVTLAERRRTS